MSNPKFKAGDKVRVRKDLVVDNAYKMDFEDERNCCFVNRMAHLRGKEVTISHSGTRYTIKEGDFCWVDEMFEPLENKIVITTDGKTTLARLYNGKEVIKSAEAKLSKNDEFDFMTGAKLAFDRLVEPKKPDHIFEVGKLYKLNDSTDKGIIKVTSIKGTYLTFEIVSGLTRWDGSKEFGVHSIYASECEPYKGIIEGDIVKISNRGHLYTTYSDWVEKHTVSNRDRYKYDYDNYPDLKNSFKVIKIAPHGSGNDTLAYITDLKTTRCYLVGIRGLKKA